VPYYEHARDKHAHDEHADLTLDLASPDSIRAAVRRVQPDLIVNAAAYTAVDKAESEPELAMAVNGIAPGVLAEEARRVGAALVHYSTDYVFDGTGETPWCEDDATGPQNTYGRTKLVGEEAIQAAGAPHLILRVSWVYGLHGSNFVKTMLRLGMQRPALSVVDDQWGAPTSARVIADITGQILVQGRGDWPGFLRERGGVVHLVCQGQTNWHRFAQKIFELAGAQGVPLAVKSLSPIPSSQYPTPARRPANSRMSCQRLWERFGLAPPSWQVALEQSFPLPSLPPQVERKAA
jgi:dTDP-4-dehydrorhamnose reductase